MDEIWRPVVLAAFGFAGIAILIAAIFLKS